MWVAKTVVLKFLPILFLVLFLCYLYLDRELEQPIEANPFTCLSADQGYIKQEALAFNNIYGVGLAYANHINETASDFDPTLDAPVFKKHSLSVLKQNSRVNIPTQDELLRALKKLEPNIANTLNQKALPLLPLLDYEAELAFVLLEDINTKALMQTEFVPKIGFLVTNDLSARGIAILGEGQDNRYDYWGASKSHPGFAPINGRVWVPNQHQQNAIPCVTLETYVDGELRQHENTRNLVYTPTQMLRFVHKRFPDSIMRKGDIILTGTPGGVILNVPRWKARLATLLGLDRFQKLAINQKPHSAARFLKAGDNVHISAQWLGNVDVAIVESAQ